MQLTFGVAAAAFAAVAASGVAGYAWRHRERTGASALVAFNVAVAIWAGATALQVASRSLEAKLLWIDVQYVGLSIVPVAILACALSYTGRDGWLTRRRLATIFAPLLLVIALSWTNEWHHLVRESETLVEVGGHVRIDREWGPAFWLAWLYSNGLSVFATLLLLGSTARAHDVFRRQGVAIAIGALVPWAGHFLYLAGTSTIEPASYFAVTGVTFTYATTRQGFLDAIPVARDSLLEVIDDGVIVVDVRDRVVDCNDTAASILGREADAVVGRRVDSAFADRPALLERYRHGGDGDVFAVETADGERRRFELRRSSLEGAANLGPAGTLLVLHDVTELARRERALERKNDRLERVAETIAHDLRNPLGIVRGYAAVARETGDEEAFDRIERGTRRMETIVDEVLAMARRDWEAADGDPVRLSEAAERAWRGVETPDATLEVVDPGHVVRADEAQLVGLFENLFRNAVEHAAGGTVAVGALPDGFYVEDDGPGIPEPERDAIFDRGYTTRESGTGFGLGIVRLIVDGHGWDVAVTDGDRGGVRFEVTGATVPGRRERDGTSATEATR